MDAAGVIYMEDKVKESELIGKVHSAVYHQCKQRGYAAPADVLVDRQQNILFLSVLILSLYPPRE